MKVHISLRETFTILQNDICRYGPCQTFSQKVLLCLKSLYTHPGLLAVIYYRISRWLWTSKQSPLHRLLLILLRMGYPIVRLYSGVELSPRAQIGSGLCIMHFGPIVIHPDTIAGKNLTLLHGVTLGATKEGTPRIGDNVAIGIGASIIGHIIVGNNVNVGAGAVVVKDLPDNCTAVGIPAKPIWQALD